MSEVQWRDIKGLVRGCSATLDARYVEEDAQRLGVLDLLNRAQREV